MWTYRLWQGLCLLVLYCHVGCGQDSENSCMPTYSPFECRTCFRAFSESSVDLKTFDDGLSFCRTQGSDGQLLVLSNQDQQSLLSTYLKLNGISEALWIGLQYVDGSGTIRLVDINGDTVDETALGIVFEDGPSPAAGLCVSIMNKDDGTVSFVRKTCITTSYFICTTSSIGLEITNFASAPDGHGLLDQSLTISCDYSPSYDNVVIEWSRNGTVLGRTSGPDTTYTIQSFQQEDSGYYACSVLVMDGSTVLGGARSAEMNIRLAVLPTLSRWPADRLFYRGGLAFLECGVNPDIFPEPTVEWYKDSTALDFSNSKLFFSPNTKSLIIGPTELTDTGNYTCVVSNVAGTISHSANLTVTEPNSSASQEIILEPLSVTAVVGADATFDCVGQIPDAASYFYQWNSVDRLDDRGTHLSEIRPPDISSLVLTNLQFDSAYFGVLCQFSDTGSETALQPSRIAELTLVEPVSITDQSSGTMFVFGATVTLWCAFKGTPSPSVQWYFKGKLISETLFDVTATDESVNGRTTLTIDNFQVKDVGSYQCALSNYLQSVRYDFSLCGQDGTPGLVGGIMVSAISQTQVKVTWSPPVYANSDPDLLQYKIYWDGARDGVTLTVDIVRNVSKLIPYMEEGYIIGDLNPLYQLSATVIAVSYLGVGETEGTEFIEGQTYGQVPQLVPTPKTTRSEDGKYINVTWEAIIPDPKANEGPVVFYDLRYYRTNDINRMLVLNLTTTEYQIMDVQENREYTVEVRSVVLNSSEPTVTYRRGEWGKGVVQKPITIEEGSSDDNSTLIIIVVVVVVVVVLILVVLIGCVVCQTNKRLQRGRYFPAKKEQQKSSLRLKQAIYNDGNTTVLTGDSSGLHPSTNGKYEV